MIQDLYMGPREISGVGTEVQACIGRLGSRVSGFISLRVEGLGFRAEG